METKINQEIRTSLKHFEDKYFIDGTVNKQRVIQDLYNYDSELIAAMLNSDLLKENFTMQVADTTIFQINNLIELFEADEFWKDSYTKYSKKIGLTSGGKFIDECTDVVLDFPYKDTVLKASMSKEDTDKEGLRPEEPFLNEIIAKEEIDVLLDKKIFVNAKRYSSEGEERTDCFEDENLIIKGNNLLALHTLKENYTGRVKTMFIDPPYNTGGDSFQYNDSFNHSTWLTFMKNRLEVALELLREDGTIFIQTDDAEQAYLKVLMDGIFGRKNYINTISVQFKDTAGASGGGEDKRLKKNVEYITIFAKNREIHKGFKSIYNNTNIGELVRNYREEGKSWKYTSILVNDGEKVFLGETKDGSGNVIKLYKRIGAETKSISSIMKEENLNEYEAYSKYADKLFQTTNAQTSIRTRVWEAAEKLNNSADIVSIEYLPRTGKNKGQIYEQFYKGPKFRLFVWLRDTVDIVNGELVKKDSLGTSWNFIAETKNVNKEGNVNFSNGKKPELLIANVIEMSTDEDEIVLDFFMGSATTQAAAMKMNRKFIGIEQMDYTNTISVPRLQKVIEGEQGGISKAVGWQGGGSFVYAELMEKNTGFLKSVMAANSMTELQEVFSRMLETADFDFRVDLDEVRGTIWQLPVEDQKRILIKIIDKNQLYYNYSEIDDANVRDLIADTDYAFNQSFYAERGE